MQKILLDDQGLAYICATYERFFAVATVLSTMTTSLMTAPSSRLLKHIIRCYLRLSDNPRAREALRQCLPEALRDGMTFMPVLKEDMTTRRCLATLLVNLGETAAATQVANGGVGGFQGMYGMQMQQGLGMQGLGGLGMQQGMQMQNMIMGQNPSLWNT